MEKNWDPTKAETIKNLRVDNVLLEEMKQAMYLVFYQDVIKVSLEFT